MIAQRAWKSACTWLSSRHGRSATSSSPWSIFCWPCWTTSAAQVLKACAANIDELRRADRFHRRTHPRIEGTDEIDTQPTLGFQRVIQRAILHVQSSTGKKESPAPTCWWRSSAKRTRTRCITSTSREHLAPGRGELHLHGIAKAPPQGNPPQGRSEPEQASRRGRKSSGGALESYTQNLNQQALVGKIDPLIGRENTRSSASSRPCAAGARTTRCWSARPAWARPRSPKAWRAHRRGPRARRSRRTRRLRARHGRAAGRHQVPRRFRAAPEGRAQAAIENPNAILFIDEIHT